MKILTTTYSLRLATVLFRRAALAPAIMALMRASGLGLLPRRMHRGSLGTGFSANKYDNPLNAFSAPFFCWIMYFCFSFCTFSRNFASAAACFWAFLSSNGFGSIVFIFAAFFCSFSWPVYAVG